MEWNRNDDALGGLQLGEDVGDVGLVEGRERKALLADGSVVLDSPVRPQRAAIFRYGRWESLGQPLAPMKPEGEADGGVV